MAGLWSEDVRENTEFYEALLLKAFEVCTEIARHPRPAGDPSAERIWEAACEFVAGGEIRSTAPSARAHPVDGAAFEALDKLRADWPLLCRGKTSGEKAYKHRAELWQGLMCEPPMGSYARLAARLVNACARPGQKIIELGAGVGNASRLLDLPGDVSYIRTDRNPFLLSAELPGSKRLYDFDTPPDTAGADIVFAVNSLHCARSPRRTLSYARDMLGQGGILVLAEGEPQPSPGRPWALDVLFCQFRGWWDRGGFRPRSVWIDDIRSAGCTVVQYQRLIAGDYDLGGLIWARR